MSAESVSDDPFGQAIWDYQQGDQTAALEIETSLDAHEVLPASYLFRSYHDCPLLERMALDRCRGTILDVGAGAGSHALHLQRLGCDVTALERSTLAVKTMRERGLRQVQQGDFFQASLPGFDTVLMLMNGIGLVGQLSRLPDFFERARTLLNAGGQILLDSSDLIGLFENEAGVIELDHSTDYYGEVHYHVRYAKRAEASFDWLFVDPDTLQDEARAHGFLVEVLAVGDHDDYLARMTIQSDDEWCDESGIP